MRAARVIASAPTADQSADIARRHRDELSVADHQINPTRTAYTTASIDESTPRSSATARSRRRTVRSDRSTRRATYSIVRPRESNRRIVTSSSSGDQTPASGSALISIAGHRTRTVITLDEDHDQGSRTVYPFDPRQLDVAGGARTADPGRRP